MELKDILKDSLHGVLDPLMEANARKSSGNSDTEDDEHISISKYLRGVATGNWSHAKKEASLYEEAMKYSEDVGTEGGLLVHPKIQEQIIPLIRKRAVIRSLNPQVVNLPNTNTLQMPRQTQASDYAWVGDNSDIEDDVDQEVRWGDIELVLKTVAGFARIPNTLLEDSTPAADRLVTNDIAKVLALAEDEAFLIGDGGTEPLGIYHLSEVNDVNVNAQLDGADGFDTLIDAQTAVENVSGEYTSWLMNPTMKGIIRQLKDTNDRHIWSQGDMTKGEPDSLLGVPVYYSRQIPGNMDYDGDTLANRTFIVLADWSEFMIVQKRDGISMKSSDVASDAFEQNQTVFRGIRRVDGGPRVPENFYILKNIHTA
jgi:HK97 family phage major capsid protein